MTDTQPANDPVENVKETPYIKFWMEGDILCAAYHDNLHIDLAMAKQVVADRISFSGNTDRYCYADMRGVRSATKEARQHFADEGSRYISAGALLIESVLSKTLGNIFLKVNKPKAPIRLFTSKDEAMAWLKQKQKEARAKNLISF